MQKWDDRLAEVAEKWAKQCVNQHDKVRSIPSRYFYCIYMLQSCVKDLKFQDIYVFVLLVFMFNLFDQSKLQDNLISIHHLNTRDFVIDYSARFYDCRAECGRGTAKLDGSHPGLVGRDTPVEIRTGTGHLSRIQRVA